MLAQFGGLMIDAMASVELENFDALLNERQREAVLATEGPLLVLAGAGSGKTKMLTSRISYLMLFKKIPAYQILAVTFTNKAAAEMRERVEKNTARFGGGGLFSPPEIGTFHSVCVRVLRREMERTPFTQPFVIYDDSDQLGLIKGALNALQIDDKNFNPKSIQAKINRLKCDAIEPHEYVPAPHDVFGRQVKRVYEHYQKDLFSNNAIDFGEILCMTYRLLRDHMDLRQKYQNRYRYIHVDEYQDTNHVQYLLLQMLAAQTYGGHQNICVVGDEDQSIYSWRGANIKNILNFESDFPGAKVVKLEQNYRSTQTILNVAGHVIRNNRSRKDKTLWTENGQGQQVMRAQLPDERAEAEVVGSEIRRLASEESRTYNDFAIFYRTNAQSRQFEDVLRREKIPYQVVGGLRFYDRKEIKDILAYFKVILNSSDSVSLKRIINVPGRGIGKTTLDKLDQFHLGINLEKSITYWSVLERASHDPGITSAATAKKLKQFVVLVQRLKAEQPQLLLSELYHLLLDETGYIRQLREEDTDESLNRIENLEEFDTLLKEFEEDQLQDVPENLRSDKLKELLPLFIEQSTLASDVDQMEGHTSSIKLMTLHSSKGLEFPVVFMVGMEEGLFPSVRPWEETPEEDIEEERRLCYVGMTRARELLYLMNVVTRRIWGNVSYQEPSRFFSEVPDELLEFRDLSFGKWAKEVGKGAKEFHSKELPSRMKENLWVGRHLIHPDYGNGTVVAAEGLGADEKVVVQFRDQQKRKFLLRYVAQYFA